MAESKLQKLKRLQAEAAENGTALQAPTPPALPKARKMRYIKAQLVQRARETGIDEYAPRDTPSASAKATGDLAHYQAALSADIARLATLKDIAEKAKAKSEMIPTYWPFVNAYIDNGDNYPNDVAVTVCIWLFDTLDIERGLDVALVLIQQKQITPPKFDRDLPTFVCDAVYDWANALLKMDPQQSASPYLDTLVATIDNHQWSLSPPVQSKMYAMLAKHKLRVGEYAEAVALCEKAESVNPEGHGTKGLKKDAQTRLKEQTKDD